MGVGISETDGFKNWNCISDTRSARDVWLDSKQLGSRPKAQRPKAPALGVDSGRRSQSNRTHRLKDSEWAFLEGFQAGTNFPKGDLGGSVSKSILGS